MSVKSLLQMKLRDGSFEALVVTRARQDARYRLSLQRNSLALVDTMADTLQLSKSRSLPSSGSRATGGVLLSAARLSE